MSSAPCPYDSFTAVSDLCPVPSCINATLRDMYYETSEAKIKPFLSKP